MPISVIISGKLLSKPLYFSVKSKQIFKIPLKILVIEANDGEVILGFTGFIITLFLVAIFGGKSVYTMVKVNFGIDPGQFNSLCMFSSFITVIWSTLLFLLYIFFLSSKFSSFVVDEDNYKNIIEKLSRRDRGE